MKEIYFDNASTGLPVYSCPEAYFGNASTTHTLGVRAYNALSKAKKDICQTLGCNAEELVLTSGGTESNNLAIIGYATAHKRSNMHFAALPWAHPSVTEPIKQISDLGYGRIATFDSCYNNPGCNVTDRAWLSEGANFICFPQICHETGDMYDVEKISNQLKQLNPKNIIHIDGVQGYCKEKLSLKNIDLYSFSGHKIHAPLGTGGLFVKKGVRLSALFFGGGQEMGLRAGTYNTKGIVDLAYVAKRQYESLGSNFIKVTEVKAELLKLVDEMDDVYVNSCSESSPYILNMSFMGVKGEVLVNMLSEKGIYISTGAACKVSKKEVPALVQMGFTKDRADSAVRFSFSHYNTTKEATQASKAIIECVTTLRKIQERK